MKMIFRFIPKLVFVFLFLWSALGYAQSIFVYRDFGQKGDENQVRGVIKAYSSLKKDVEVKEFNVGDEEKLRASVLSAVKQEKEKPIVIAAGEKTVASCSANCQFEGATTVHLCHMITKEHPALVGKVDLIAVPIHAASDFDGTLKGSKTKLIKTIGVAHNRQIEEIEDTYEKSNLPKSESYIGVILGGDAPTPEGKIQLFTEQNARELARYVAPLIKIGHLLIINGPRTGKHDSKVAEIKTAHRDGKVDHVTQAFLSELEKAGIPSKQFTLFDFQFGKSSPHDMDLLLGAVRATKGEVLVPGESTSSVSESVDVLPRGAVIVYDTTSMNPVHQAHVKSELDAGRVKYLREGYDKMESKEGSINDSTSAAETIALELFRQ